MTSTTATLAEERIPSWTGRLGDLDAFEEDITIALDATKRDERILLCSRIIGKMPHASAQRRISLIMPREQRNVEDGPLKLIEHLRKEMGNNAPIDITMLIDMYLYQMLRTRGESMVAYTSREQEVYGKLLTSYKRLKPNATEVFPDEVRGCLVLRNCGLQPSEKANVWSTAGSVYTVDAINKALIQTWPEEELARRDQCAGQQAHGALKDAS